MDQQGQQGQKPQKGTASSDGRPSARSSANDLPYWSPGTSDNSAFNPSPSTHSLLGSSPLIPALVLLIGAILLLSSGWFKKGLSATGNLSAVQAVYALLQKKPPPVPGVKVWVIGKSGYYYCRGGMLFGRRPGNLKRQDEALMSGFRPADGNYCADGKPDKPSSHNLSLQTRPHTK